VGQGIREGQRVNYVMVPVPEELAPKVLQFISWRDQPLLKDLQEAFGDAEQAPNGAAPSRDGDPVSQVFTRLDDQSRSVLAVVAAAALGGEQLTVTETAQRAEVSERELIGIVTEVNNLVAGAGGSLVTILVTDIEGAQDEAFSWAKRLVRIQEPAARTIAGLGSAPAD
jgi:hypothetical protein